MENAVNNPPAAAISIPAGVPAGPAIRPGKVARGRAYLTFPGLERRALASNELVDRVLSDINGFGTDAALHPCQDPERFCEFTGG